MVDQDGGSLASPDGFVSLQINKDTVAEPVNIRLSGRAVDDSRKEFTAYEFGLLVNRVSHEVAVDVFAAPIDLTLSIPPSVAEALGSEASRLSILHLSKGGYWHALGGVFDEEKLAITASTAETGIFALAADPLLFEGEDEKIVYPLEGGIVASENGEVKVEFTKDDVAERLSVTIDVKDPCDEHPSSRDVLTEFELTAKAIDRADAPVTQFDQSVHLEVKHTLERMIPYAPDSFRLYRLDDETGAWVEVPAEIDPSRGLVKAELNGFSTYSTQAESDIVFPPGNLHFQVDMQSGAATASIPIALPPGPGGFGPSLSLNYASSAVDEMKTAKTMAGWVGAGWNLSVPHITKDPFSGHPIPGRYFISMNGVSDLLIRENNPLSGDTYRFHTKRESHLYITGKECAASDGDIYYEFTVKTKDGTVYEFGTKTGQTCAGHALNPGSTPDSLQYFTRYWEEDGWHRFFYRADVSRITDTRDNTIEFIHWQDVRTDGCPPQPTGCTESEPYIRAAYPHDIYWGGNNGSGHIYRVAFGLDADWENCPTVGSVRSDAPIDLADTCVSGSCPGADAPNVMETRFLSELTVSKISGNATIRSYEFDYDHIDRDSYNGCPVSGALELEKVFERGKDGGLFRTMDPGYENHAVQWEDIDAETLPCTSNNDGAPSRPYLNSFKNGFGGETTFTYQRQWMSISAGCGWARWVVVNRTLEPNGPTGGVQPPLVYTYEYSGLTYGPDDSPNGIASVEDREFRGFSSVTENQPSGGNDRLECDFFVDEYNTGLTDECNWYDNSVLKQRVTNTYTEVVDSVNNVGCTSACSNWETVQRFRESKFIRLDRVAETFLTGKADLWTSYQYDEYGNVTLACEHTNVPSSPCSGGGLYRKTEHQYAENESLYIVGLPKQTRLLTSGGSEVSRQQFYYDNLGFGSVNEGLVTRIDTAKDSGEITQEFEYDTYGNQTQSWDGVRETTTDHSACNNTQPASVTTASKTTNYSYGDCVLGLPEMITTPDGVVQNLRHDEFGRLEREWLPGDSQTTPTIDYDYEWNATFPNTTTVKHRDGSSGSGYLEVTHHVDGFGREIQMRSEISCSGTASVVDIAYNSAGHKASESIPYSSSGCSNYTSPGSANKTQYQYDVLGRVTGVSNPDGTSRSIEYTPNDSVQYLNERNFCTEHQVDSFGRIIFVRESRSQGTSCTNQTTTSYFYDQRDNLTGITDVAGNTTIIGYDKAGWKDALNDPDTGFWSYAYFDDGQLKNQTDARGITTEFFYDSLGRIQTKRFRGPSGLTVAPDVSYTYDTCQLSSCGAINGRLTKVVEWAETILYDYDSRGRLAQEQHQIAGQNYDVSYSYDSMDRVTQTTYPVDGEIVNRTYDAQGMPETVSSAFRTYLDSDSIYNAAGLPEELIFVDNVAEIHYDYRPSDFRLENIRTSPVQFVNTTYGYDGVGNITSVSDTVEGSNISYGYDWADRLETVSGMPGGHVEYDYDDIGNFTLKEEGATTFESFNYGDGSPGPGPHAVTSVFGASGNFHTYEYDEIGNLLREKDGNRVINEFNYDPAGHVYARHSEPFETGGADYYYNNSDGTLVRKVSHSEGITVYVGDIYEKNLVTNEATKYYFADGQRIAMARVAPNGIHTWYFLASDHLGGTSVVMTAGGTLVNRVRYYPYGGIRDEDYGSGASELITDRLFTGQQRQAGSTIYHYGARFYNTATGTFVQADPMMPDWQDPKTLNRYAYVLNNPIKYSDPTGMKAIMELGGGGGGAVGGTLISYEILRNLLASPPEITVPDVSIPDFSLPCIFGCGSSPAVDPGSFPILGPGTEGLGTLFSGGADPVLKGQRGVDEAIQALEEIGYDVRGQEVTLELGNGEKIRVDIWAKNPEGKDVAIEVKTGSERSAPLPQSRKYVEVHDRGGMPRGLRAQQAGLVPGEHVEPIEIEVIYVVD